MQWLDEFFFWSKCKRPLKFSRQKWNDRIRIVMQWFDLINKWNSSYSLSLNKIPFKEETKILWNQWVKILLLWSTDFFKCVIFQKRDFSLSKGENKNLGEVPFTVYMAINNYYFLAGVKQHIVTVENYDIYIKYTLILCSKNCSSDCKKLFEITNNSFKQ